MDVATIEGLGRDLLIVLVAGFLAGVVCRRLGISLMVGYLLIGAVIGEGGLRLVSQHHQDMEYLARGGVLLLLFAIGIEFSLTDLARLSRFFFIGGFVQMSLVALTVGLLAMFLLPTRAALLMGAACALSSTVIVFRALSEVGESRYPHGRRAIAILLFQDVALVPLMLLVPMLSEEQAAVDLRFAAVLAAKTVGSVVVVLLLRRAVNEWGVRLLAWSRSRELVLVFTLSLLVCLSWSAHRVGLPPALGAFAAGLILSGNRMTPQIDALIAPYRESFSVVFFVTLGTLMYPEILLSQPLLVLGGFVMIVAVKAAAAAVAVRLTGLDWGSSWGIGLSLAQLGEFAFVLFAMAHSQGLLPDDTYRALLLIALGTLVATPMLIRLGRRWISKRALVEEPDDSFRLRSDELAQAIIIGAGPVGGQVANQLECYGVDVCLIDLSPVNLYSFEQQGIRTVVGDGRDLRVLQQAGIGTASLAIVTVPDDVAALEVTRALKSANPQAEIVVRCRFRINMDRMESAGASSVISEELQAAHAILSLLNSRL